MRAVLVLAVAVLSLSLVSCSDRGGGRPPGGRRDSGPGGGRDAGRLPDGALPPVNPCATSCGPTELCGDMGDGNGLDDNCDGRVDEGCPCPATGITRPCFAGPPDRRDIGACADGIEQCD